MLYVAYDMHHKLLLLSNHDQALGVNASGYVSYNIILYDSTAYPRIIFYNPFVEEVIEFLYGNLISYAPVKY